MKEKKQFINLLRVLAAVCITNSHFANVWPMSGIASGGMLGDVLFFAISGYCLYRPEFKMQDFGRWYIKRIRRIYITVILIALLTGFFTGFPLSVSGWLHTFIYPTNYHFVASIMVLYIVYYVWMNLLKRWKISIEISAVVFSVAVLIVYVLTFDKSWYHIDVVENHFIRFLFLAAMLLGAYFREAEQRAGKYTVNSTWKNGMLAIVSIIVYFAVRLAVPRFGLHTVQIFTWAAILFALYCIIRWAESLESFLIKLPGKVKGIPEFLAGITLQIYLVQFPIIERFETLAFPINLFVITIAIMVAAVVVYLLDHGIQKGIDMLFHYS